MKGYLQAIVKAGLQPIPMWDVPLVKSSQRLEPEDYIPRLRSYMTDQGCTAVVTYHAFGAASVLSACYTLGIRVPHDLSIIACDYDPILEYLPVKMTSMHLDRIEMGKLAVDMLLQQIDGDAPSVPTILLKGKLQEFSSVVMQGHGPAR